MRNRIQPLLCEFHSHTTWSDGSLSISELVDLYGGRGFDVLCISDHTVRYDDPWRGPAEWPPRDVRREVHAAYLEEIFRESVRAQSLYDLLVLPGIELTYNAECPDEAAHAVAVGLTRFVSVDDGIAGRSRRPVRPAPRSSRRTRSTTSRASSSLAGPAGSQSTRSSSSSSIGSSSSTGRRCSAGSPGPACPRSPTATFTGPSILVAGRRSSRARRAPTQSSPTSAPRGRRT